MEWLSKNWFVNLTFTKNKHTVCLNWEFFSFTKLHGDWSIQKLHGSHHCLMSWPASDKGNMIQPSSASTKESENIWLGLWLSCLLRRLTWIAAESMRLSTDSDQSVYLYDDKTVWKKICCYEITFIAVIYKNFAWTRLGLILTDLNIYFSKQNIQQL